MTPAANAKQQLPLEDIVLPHPVSWWPPAPGWWILAVLVVASIIIGLIVLQRRRRAAAYRRQALRELQQLRLDYQHHQDIALFSQNINNLLKRVAIVHFGKRSVSRLSGDAWLMFLNQYGPANFPLETARQWQVVCYQSQSQWPQLNESAVFDMAQHWIKKHSKRDVKKQGG